MRIIRIYADDIHIFRALTSRPNMAYSVVKYEENELKQGDIAEVY